MPDGTHTIPTPRLSYRMSEREQRLSDLVTAGDRFIREAGCGFVSALTTKNHLEDAGRELAAWVKKHSAQVAGTAAGSSGLTVALTYLPAQLRDTAMDGLTEDAADVFQAAFDLAMVSR